MQGAIAQASARVDALVAGQGTPPVLRQSWDTVKGLMRQATEATELRRYVGGQQGAVPKKAQ